MALTASEMKALGTKLPPFRLPCVNSTVDGIASTDRSDSDYVDSKLLVVAFICNHCPYVHLIEPAFLELVTSYQTKGVAFVGICSNSKESHPSDHPDRMAERAVSMEYNFPYLHDDSQETAKEFGAVCTPDFFVYQNTSDGSKALAYRGRLNDASPGSPTVEAHDLSLALDELLAGKDVSREQTPSIGCNIKWRQTG